MQKIFNINVVKGMCLFITPPHKGQMILINCDTLFTSWVITNNMVGIRGDFD